MESDVFIYMALAIAVFWLLQLWRLDREHKKEEREQK